MNKHWSYLKYVLRHKWYVFKACLKYDIVWQGIIHDWTKFLPVEWFPYVHFFYGKKHASKTGYFHKSGHDRAFDIAWNHHQKANPHHWQYWIIPTGENTNMYLPMPDKYRKEMLADWTGAGLAQGKPDIKAWYMENRQKILLHRETREWIEDQLGIEEKYNYE